MKAKKVVGAFIISLFLTCGLLQIGLISGEEEAPDEITINNEGYKSKKRGPVPFTHLNHSEDYDVACNRALAGQNSADDAERRRPIHS